MFKTGQVLYFTPFYFKDASPSKPKYFIVLKVLDGGDVVLVSLPSSQRYLPSSVTVTHGCVEIPDACISCYIFEAKRPVTDGGWSFQLDTFLYGQYLDTYEVALLEEIYPIEGVDYEIIGKLTQQELRAVVQCFANSSSVKRKIKRLLQN
jgi:hypothetical protein